MSFKAIRSIKREKTKSQLDKLTRYVHWSQQLLTERDISYTRLTDFVDSKFAGKLTNGFHLLKIFFKMTKALIYTHRQTSN